ncbi:MAG: hypothetical protein JNK72_17975 [Myxococcales bacterium]|nr:hypothetical protein [Myxococcales bacterium]
MRALTLVLGVLALGCTRTVPPSANAELVALTGVPALGFRLPGEQVLDLSAHEATVGRPLAALADSDEEPGFEARWLRPTGPARTALGSTPLLAFHLLGDGRAVALTRRGALLRLDAPEAAPVTLAEHVYGPLSFDAAHRLVTFTQGEAPMVGLRVLDLQRAQLRSLAPSLASVWSPTLSPDGHEVLLMASPEGRPAWFRVRLETDEVVPLNEGTTLQSNGPSAARVWGDVLVVENERGVFAMTFDGTLRRSFEGYHAPVLSPDGARLVLQGRAERWVTVSASALEVGR